MLLQLWLAHNWPKLSSCTQLCDSPFSSTLLPHLCIHCRTTSLGLSVGLSLPPLFLILVLKSQFDLAPKYAISFILRLYLSLRCVLFNHLVSVTSLFPRQDRHGSIQIFCMHWSLSLSGIDNTSSIRFAIHSGNPNLICNSSQTLPLFLGLPVLRALERLMLKEGLFKYSNTIIDIRLLIT